MTTSTFKVSMVVTPTSSRAARILYVSQMAAKLRYFFDSQGSQLFGEFEDLIKKQERRHRKGYPGGYAESVAVAADYFIVKCFAEAFEVFEKNDGSVPASALGDHGQGQQVVRADAEWSLHNPLLRALSSMDDRRTIEQSIDLSELKLAATLLDYSADIARR